ncbi:MAG: hypothetical protein LC750_00320 [Actinobacteria bacterium]|nr:hypothetical protein [Actinomycetota bacterium]
MGRELRRVALDFDWPANKVWQGFLNPLYVATKCAECDGEGYSADGRRLKALWYGHMPFKPEDRGSVPFTPADEAVAAFATRNVTRSPEFYGHGQVAIDREARRLCALWNGAWSHHLNTGDVAALVAADRLYDLTHTFDPVNRWRPKDPPHVPTPREVNVWSISGGMGHDSINQYVCVKAECERLGVPLHCSACNGDGELWPSADAKQAYEDWQEVPPPAGDGYQIWETVSEGSPISPVFASPEELATHMAGTKWGADEGTPYETWLAFINGPGWAPSMVMDGRGIHSGVDAAVTSQDRGAE